MTRVVACGSTIVVAALGACGDPLLDRASVLNLVSYGGQNNSPNCLAVGDPIDVLTGFAGQQVSPSVDMTLDAQGRPAVGWLATTGPGSAALHVDTWSNGAWARAVETGDSVGILDTRSEIAEDLVLRYGPAGQLYAAWPTVDTGTSVATLHMMQSDGNSWTAVPLFSGASVATPLLFRFAFDIHPSGSAAVVWFADNPSLQSVLTSANLAGESGWVSHGTVPEGMAPVIAAESGGLAVLAWSGQDPKLAEIVNGNYLSVSGADDGNFAIADTGATPSAPIAYAAAGASNATQGLAWEDDREGSHNIYYRQGNDTWSPLGDSDSGLGISELTHPSAARHVALVMEGAQNPIMAYEDVSAHQIIVQTWTGRAWSGPLTMSRASNSAWWPKLVASADGGVFLAWEEDNARIQVCRLR